MVQREGPLQAFGGDAALREHRAGVVDQRVDARLDGRDRLADAPRLGHQLEVGDVGAMAAAGRDLFELRQRRLGAFGVARDKDDARAHRRQFRNRGFADARRRAGRDHRLALHEEPLLKISLKPAIRAPSDPAIVETNASDLREFRGAASAVFARPREGRISRRR